MTDTPSDKPEPDDEADVTDADDFDMAEVESILDDLRRVWTLGPGAPKAPED